MTVRWLAAGCVLAGAVASHGSIPWTRGSGVAHASTFIELSLPDLLARASSVAVVTPLESRALWEETPGGQGRRIVTYTRVKAERVLDGAPLDITWVRTLGGRVGDIGQRVDGDAVLVPQQRTLLFLASTPEGPHVVVGMGQGQFPLESVKGGLAPRVLAPLSTGRLLPNAAPTGPRSLPARALLPGKTVDEVVQLLAGARRSHVP